MTHRLATNYAKNYCNRTPIVKVIVESVVTCFFGTRCTCSTSSATNFIAMLRDIMQTIHRRTGRQRRVNASACSTPQKTDYNNRIATFSLRYDTTPLC